MAVSFHFLALYLLTASHSSAKSSSAFHKLTTQAFIFCSATSPLLVSSELQGCQAHFIHFNGYGIMSAFVCYCFACAMMLNNYVLDLYNFKAKKVADAVRRKNVQVGK